MVDWDVMRVDGSMIELQYYVNEPGCSLALSRVEIDERNDEVSLRVVVGLRETKEPRAQRPTRRGPRLCNSRHPLEHVACSAAGP